MQACNGLGGGSVSVRPFDAIGRSKATENHPCRVSLSKLLVVSFVPLAFLLPSSSENRSGWRIVCGIKIDNVSLASTRRTSALLEKYAANLVS